MKLLIAVLMGLLAGGVLGAEEKPLPVVRLSDGRVLRNVTFARYGGQTVTLRSHAGPVTVRYEALPDDVRSAAEQKRPGGPKWFAGDTSENTLSIEGQVFIATAGAGAYKFGNVDVYAFDVAAWQSFSQRSQGGVRLPRPIHKVTTDADGKFTLKVPVDRAFFIFAQASRLRTAGLDSWTERFEWRVPMSAVREGQLLRLSDQHREPFTERLEIERVD